MKILNILLFLIYLYGFGYSLTRFLKNTCLETHFCRLGVGLGCMPVIGVVLNFLHIPLDWRIFLVLAVILPLYDLFSKKHRFPSKIKKPTLHLFILLLIFITMVALYCKGPFNYPWLEDDDPWMHAAGVKYVAIEKNLDVEPGQFHYINPYPPGYDLVLGIIHQTHGSLYWTLKFFNGFIIALGYLFFYIFAKELTDNKNKALCATFFLSLIPCYLSHFIWAHSLAVTLFFPAFYTYLKSRDDKRYILPSAIVFAGIFLTQPTQSIKFLILIVLMLLAEICVQKKISKNSIIIILISVLISSLWWGPVLMEMRSGTSRIALRNNTDVTSYKKGTLSVAKEIFKPRGGTATKKYTLIDYLFSPRNNKINNPIGVGMTFCLLSFLGIFYILPLIFLKKLKTGTKTKIYYITILFWVTFTFLGMNSMTFNLPIGLFAFRFWMLFAIPMCFLGTEFLFYLSKIPKTRSLRYMVLAVILFSILKSSGKQKYSVNSEVWPYGVLWSSDSEMKSYLWLRKNLPPNTKVFTFTNNFLVMGHDMHADFWSKNYKNSLQDALNLELPQLYSALKENNFEYLVLGRMDVRKHGLEKILKKKKNLDESLQFEFLTASTKGAVIYKIL